MMEDRTGFEQATKWELNRKLVSAEDEWHDLISNLPEEQTRFLSDFLERNRQLFIDNFYHQLIQNQEAAAFLSKKVVYDDLQRSLHNWLACLFTTNPANTSSFIEQQQKIGETYARIQVPISLIMQGTRLLKNEIMQLLQQEVQDREVLIILLMHVSNAIDIAAELMSQAFVRNARKSARTDEAYRSFALSHDMPLERESQRAALMEWSQSVLFTVYGNGRNSLHSLGSSDFGLWLQHKADMMFPGSATLERLRETVTHIDHTLLPAISAASNHDAAALAEAVAEFEKRIGETKFLLAELFHAVAAMEVGRDPLTRTLNRRFMPPILSREVRMASRNGLDFSLLMVDIDHFKAINDAHGHSGGDTVLQQIAEIILSHCRPGDFVFRYGGEEFLPALVETNEQSAWGFAEDLRRQVEREAFKLPDGSKTNATLSIGIACFDGHLDYTLLVDAADRAVYRAKQSGRNRCIVETTLDRRRTEAF